MSEQLENIRRAAERGLRLAQKEKHSSFIDLFQHLINLYQEATATKTAECVALEHDIARHVRTCAELATECERLREAGARHRWRLSYISENINDNTAIRFALMASNEEIDAARKETP